MLRAYCLCAFTWAGIQDPVFDAFFPTYIGVIALMYIVGIQLSLRVTDVSFTIVS